MHKLIRIILLDVLRSRFVLFYALLLSGMAWSVFGLENSTQKALLSLLNLVLLTIPLISVMYAGSYIYNRSEFIELLLGQPIQRRRIWLSLYLGISLALLTAVFTGIGIPVLLFSFNNLGLMMIGVSGLMTIIFISLAMWVTLLSRDKARGMGLNILLWLFFALLFDGLMLFLLFQLADYPIEKMMLVFTFLNPIGLARIYILLQLEVSALLGYTGAIFKDFFGTLFGSLISLTVMGLWAVIPFIFSLRRFKRIDL